MILWWQFVFQTHTHAYASKLSRLFSLSHIIYGQIRCWRIGFCIIQCRHIIFIAWSFFFLLRPVVRHFHIWIRRWRIKSKREKNRNAIQKVRIWCMTKCRKWWNISWRALYVHCVECISKDAPKVHISESNMKHNLSAFCCLFPSVFCVRCFEKLVFDVASLFQPFFCCWKSNKI